MPSTPEQAPEQRPLGSAELSGSFEPRGPDDLAELLETLPDAVFRMDPDGRLVYANQEARRLLDLGTADLGTARLVELVRPDFRDHVARFFRRQVEERRASTYLEYPVAVGDGRELWIGQTTRLVERDGEIVGSQAVARYIGARRRQEESRRGLAMRDLETGLLSPMGFRLIVEQQSARSARIGSAFTLLVLTLRAPDTRGSGEDPGGALARLLGALRDEIRASDSVCRSGGGELSLLLPDTGPEDAELLLTRIRPRLSGAAAPWTVRARLHGWEPDDPVAVEALLSAAWGDGEA